MNPALLLICVNQKVTRLDSRLDWLTPSARRRTAATPTLRTTPSLHPAPRRPTPSARCRAAVAVRKVWRVECNIQLVREEGIHFSVMLAAEHTVCGKFDSDNICEYISLCLNNEDPCFAQLYMNLFPDFMGGSHDSMVTLDIRVRCLERVVEEMARDISLSSGRRGGGSMLNFDSSPGRSSMKYNGFHEYSNSKFGRDREGRMGFAEIYFSADGMDSGVKKPILETRILLATVMNAIFLQATMESIGIPTHVQTAFHAPWAVAAPSSAPASSVAAAVARVALAVSTAAVAPLPLAQQQVPAVATVAQEAAMGCQRQFFYVELRPRETTILS
ncbi:hypothetical protein ABZP36_018149 [Zizania latifolia]